MLENMTVAYSSHMELNERVSVSSRNISGGFNRYRWFTSDNLPVKHFNIGLLG